MKEQTYWNGEPCEARKCRVIVGDSGQFPKAWFREFVGQERDAVEVTYGGATTYLDNEDGSGWRKVTAGRGSPRFGHRGLDVAEVVAYA